MLLWQGKQDYSRDKKFGFRKKEARSSNPANSYRDALTRGTNNFRRKIMRRLGSIDLQFGCSSHSLNPHGSTIHDAEEAELRYLRSVAAWPRGAVCFERLLVFARISSGLFTFLLRELLRT